MKKKLQNFFFCLFLFFSPRLSHKNKTHTREEPEEKFIPELLAAQPHCTTCRLTIHYAILLEHSRAGIRNYRFYRNTNQNKKNFQKRYLLISPFFLQVCDWPWDAGCEGEDDDRDDDTSSSSSGDGSGAEGQRRSQADFVGAWRVPLCNKSENWTQMLFEYCIRDLFLSPCAARFPFFPLDLSIDNLAHATGPLDRSGLRVYWLLLSRERASR